MFQKSLLFFLIFIMAGYGRSIDGDTGIIQGNVSDTRKKEALIGVNIQIVGTSLGTSSDLSGNFMIENIPTGSYSVEFSYIGYASFFETDVFVRQGKPAILKIELQEMAIEGEQITVTAGYFVEEMRTQPSTLGLSREEIRRYPGGFEDVVRTVSTLPGVAINTAGGRNDLLVRGGGPSENLYIIENIEVPNINHFGTQGNSSGSLSFVNLDYVDNVSFSTGGFQARYGDKMSSVLELSLAEGRSDRPGGKVLISATQYGFNVEGPVTEKGNFIFSARKSYLDLIFKAAGLPFVPVYTDFNFSLKYNVSPRDKFYFLGLAAINRVDRDQSSLENRVTNAGILNNTQNQIIGGMNYERILDHGYLDVTLSSNLFQYRFSQIDENQTEYFNSRADEQEVNLKIDHFWAISKSVGLLNGISWKTIFNENTTIFADTIFDRNGKKVTPSEIGVPPASRINNNAYKLAGFGELEWILSHKITVNGGVRWDYYSFLKRPSYFSPRLSLKFKPLDKHQIRTSGGVYYQSPSYVWIINPFNKNLKALKNKMTVAGWDYLFRNDLRISVEGYYKNYSNLPTGTIQGITDYIILTNTGTGFGGRDDDFQSFGYFDLYSGAKGYAYGMDISLQKKYSEIPFYGQISLTLGKNRFTAGNNITYPGQYDQRFILNLYGGYKFNKNWEFSTKFRYFTGVPYTPVYIPSENPTNPEIIQNIPAEYLSARLNPAHHLDIRVDRYFYFNALTFIVFVDIQNIYNFKIPQRPRYDFWKDEIITSSDIGILPSIGISAEL